jgi:nucleoside-diphosphate-sugar epimerase
MCASYDKAKETFGWEPKISFEEGLKRTVDWFRTYLEVFYTPNSGLNRL